MAEGFARAYGKDVMVARSAGLAPAMLIAPLTRLVMEEKNILLDDQFPKGLEDLGEWPCDLVVNMSGERLPFPIGGRVIEWTVRDPMGAREEVYREVRDQIEALVMRLILDLRAGR